MKYEVKITVWVPDDGDISEDDVDQYLYYGDKHQEFALNAVPGTLKEIEQ